ncbi:hypothetical protein Tco_1525072 [Tanacetum coccineum]
MNFLDRIPKLMHKDFWDICRDNESFEARGIIDKINDYLKRLFLLWYYGFQSDIVTMEYLVKVSKSRTFWSLNEDILKITILKTNTPYPSRKIRCIRACTHQRPQRKLVQYVISREDQYAVLEIIDDLNITIEEYIRLEEEKAQKHSKVFNWETAKYGKICSLNDEIDFKISFDDSNDEDYTVIFEKNSFSYKSFSTNDLKMDSENDNEKVNLHSPEPTVSCFDDLNFFKDFENEFPAIVYNDALTSKSYLLTELILNPQHIDEFDLNNKTSLFEYDEEEQNILYFNDLFFFNIIRPDDLKSEKDNDDNDIDIIQSSEGMKLHIVMALPSREQRNPFLRGLPDLMAEGLSARMLMEHRDAQGAESARQIPDKGDLMDYWIGISSARDFLGITPSYTSIRDPILRPCCIQWT